MTEERRVNWCAFGFSIIVLAVVILWFFFIGAPFYVFPSFLLAPFYGIPILFWVLSIWIVTYLLCDKTECL